MKINLRRFLRGLLHPGLLLLALLAARPALAQRGHAYWDADRDSLARVLARTPAGPARLPLMRHLLHVRYSEPLLRELTALAGRRHWPEYPAYRAWLAAETLPAAWSGQHLAATARALDSLQLAVAQLDLLGEVVRMQLNDISVCYRLLHQPEARRAYFEHQLTYYRVHGPVENVAQCLFALGSYSVYLGDYNQTISYYLQAIDYYRTFERFKYYDLLAVVGDLYADWGNPTKALYYLHQAAAARAPITRTYVYRSLARLYLRQRQYPAALQAADQAFRAAAGLPGGEAATHRAYALALRAAIEVAQGQPAARTLARVQHLADSLHLPLSNNNVDFELDATWARYYEGRGEWARAEAAWQLAHRKARQYNNVVLQLAYLRQLARFYHARSQLALAARYYYQASRLTDSLGAQQHFRIAQYEVERDARVQQGRLAQARRQQQRTTARVQAQQRTLWGLGAGLALLAGGAALLWRLYRQKQRANSQLATQKVQLEEQAQRLGELDAAKNQFFANASHELRTPLTLVLGPLDALLADPAHPLPPAVRRPVALAHAQAQRLTQLVNRILDLTKLEAGRLALRPQPTDLAALLRRVVAQFESLATQRGVALPAPAGLPPAAGPLPVLLDGEKVEEILTNLLSNALKHTPADGTVRLRLAPPAGPAGFYAVTVADTGPGIAEAEQVRVFERFYQTPQGQAQGGTGLGLALSRELAQLLGGSLTLVSAPGQGAAFTLVFPAEALPAIPAETPVEALAAEAAEAAEAVAAGPRPRVLVVEDNADLREYLRSLLAPSCQVLLASDGQAALELLAAPDAPPVDLVTTDAMMPRLSGTELLARLRANPATSSLPVLMLTARADEAHRLQALTVGVDDYLTKPFVAAELLARVRALLARQQVRRRFATLAPEEPEEAVPIPLAPPLAPAAAAVAEVASPPAAGSAPATQQRPPAATPAGAQLARWQAMVATRLADEQFGPAEMAELLCLSERTLYRRLGELAGLTPAAWLRELRLIQARQLLEAGGFHSVAAVADAVGFASPKYFASLYAERFGRRPADYPA